MKGKVIRLLKGLVLWFVLLVEILKNYVLFWLVLVRKFGRERKKGEIVMTTCYSTYFERRSASETAIEFALLSF